MTPSVRNCTDSSMGEYMALSKATAFAGVPGLEPRLTEPESVVLPITPYPTRHPLLPYF